MKDLKINSVIYLSLDQEISNIADRLTAASSSEEVFKAERPRRGMSAKGIINVYNKAEFDAQTKNDPAKPKVRYVFYGGVFNSSKMGSVAIYSGNPMALFSIMKRRDSLFGHRIVSVSLENGLAAYVDVRFAV